MTINRVDRAVENFRLGLNCAQAIVKNYDENMVEHFSDFGSGNAPEGMCGALFAGLNILKDKELQDRLKSEFEDAAGSAKCIRFTKDRRLSCTKRVVLVQKILDEVF